MVASLRSPTACEHDSAELFLTYFTSVYSTRNVVLDVDGLRISTFDLLPNVIFSVNGVLDKLSNLPDFRSVGPGGQSGEFLFQLRSVICYLLWLIFRRSLDPYFSIYPKLSSVTPIIKSGDTSPS